MVFLVAIDGQKEGSNQSSENLDHEAVATAGDQVVHFQVAFPPTKKDLDGPAEFINGSDLLSREIKPVGGNPVSLQANAEGDHPHFFLGLVNAGRAQQSNGIIKNDAARLYFQGADHFLRGPGFNPADKMFSFGLPKVEVFMALIVAVHNGGLSRGTDLAGEGALVSLAIGEEDAGRNGV